MISRIAQRLPGDLEPAALAGLEAEGSGSQPTLSRLLQGLPQSLTVLDTDPCQEGLERLVGAVELVDQQHRWDVAMAPHGGQERSRHEEPLGEQLVLELLRAR